MRLLRLIDWLPLCEGRCRRYVVYVLFAFLLVLPFHEYYWHKFNYKQWDLLLFTGVATFIVGIRLYAVVCEHFELTVDRLLFRGTFIIDETERSAFLEGLKVHGQACARVGGLVAAVAILAAFTIVLLREFHFSRLLLGLAEVVGAYVAGTYLGRMAAHGQLGWYLNSESVEVMIQPSHLDGVAGLKPLGDFFFYQAMVVGIPAFYLAVWWFLFPIWPKDYSHWMDSYVLLLGVAIGIEIVAFLVPIWAFHRIMLRAKASWLEEADRLSLEVADLQRRKGAANDADSKEALAVEIDEKSQRFWAIENMPTWPVDARTSRRFRINNIILLVPLIGDIVGRSIKWQDVTDFINKLG